ncbi:hypothetical protein PFL02_51940 [Pseudomonas fluorescens]|nr:hypothetical protein PFL02_51940 [Pseudomonas fluorescens]
MTITAQERATLLRRAAAHSRRHPNDLFDLRMSIHDVFEGSGVDVNRVCARLIADRPPITEQDCQRMEVFADLIESTPEATPKQILGLSEMVELLSPNSKDGR